MRVTGSKPIRQTGIVLVMGLIVLLIMTLIGLSAARSTLLEERMSGYGTDSVLAFQMAEGALRTGEQSLQLPALPAFDGSDGRYTASEYTDPAGLPRWKLWEGSGEDAAWRSHASPYPGIADAPAPLERAGAHYYIEAFPRIVGPGESLASDTPVDELGFYRVTARGVGIGGRASVILQSTYKR